LGNNRSMKARGLSVVGALVFFLSILFAYTTASGAEDRSRRPTLVVVRRVVDPGQTKLVEAKCPGGSIPLAGGFRADPPLVVRQSSLGNLATPPNMKAWRVVATNPEVLLDRPSPRTMKVVVAEAICP
jgi:hypothetical protein